MTDLLEVTDLRTIIRQQRATITAVDGVSFTVKAGETVGLVGESGCGKSMTGMSVMRLLPPGGRIVSGSIRLEGRDLTRLSDTEMRHVRGNQVAVVFQDPMTSLNPTMTVGDQIAEHVRTHRGASRTQARQRALEMLGLVGVPKPAERIGTYPHQLSGGLRQRVMIAVALACEPTLLIADEPTTALDVTIQDQILDLLEDLKARLGMGLLLVSHDMGVIASRSDRVVVMYAGRVVETAGTTELFAGRRHPYTEALLESIPRPDQDPAGSLYSIPGLPPDLSLARQGCSFAPRCRYADSQCTDYEPTLTGGTDHSWACFHPIDAPSAVSYPSTPAVRTAPNRRRGADTIVARREQATEAALEETTESAPAEPLLVVDHLVKDYPVTTGLLQRRAGSIKAVSDVSFSVRRGETFGLVGESGSGKSTLGRLVVGLERPDAGSIRFDGTETTALRGRDLRRIRRHLQLMFQDPYASLDPRMRVGPALREPMAIQKLGDRRSRQERTAELLSEVGFSPRVAGLYPHELSGGQRQRIGFARSLATRPRLVVADEPVSALDVSIRSQILNLMNELRRAHDLTYVVISHDLSVIRYLADRLAVMYLGQIVETGPSDAVYRAPAHPYTAGLLAAIPVPNPAVERKKRAFAIESELPSPRDPPSGCRFRTRCPLARSRCAEEQPVLRSFGSDHDAACHFPLRPPSSTDSTGMLGHLSAM